MNILLCFDRNVSISCISTPTVTIILRQLEILREATQIQRNELR